MIPDASREQLLDAMVRFDRELRDSSDWAEWEEQGNRRYAIEHDGRLYPVKQIIVLATGIDRGAFKGGDEANGYLETRGFTVVPIRENVAQGDTPSASSMVDRLARAVASTQQPGSAIAYDRTALDRLIAIFKQRFSSFTSQEYLDSERIYKLMAAERMHELIGPEVLHGYIDQGNFEEARSAIAKSCQGSFKISATIRQSNNLLNQWDMHMVLDAPAEPLARRLYDMLYGDGPFAERFEALADVLSQKKRGVWQPATYFLMLHDPAKYIFIKPAQFQFFLKSVGIDEQWPTKPNAAAYARYLDVAQQLLSDLAPLGARDLIDVQSFLWSVAYYANRAAWIFQSNPQYYDLPGALMALDEIDWQVQQHEKDIKAGDTVYLWEAGDEAGILAVARVLAEPRDPPAEPSDAQFYRDRSKFGQAQPHVPLQIEQVLPQRITRDELLADPALKDMAILKQPRGTNFKLTNKEAVALGRLIDEEQVLTPNTLAEWQNSISAANKPLVSHIIRDYPLWLRNTFGEQAEFRTYGQPSFGVAVGNVRMMFCQFTREDSISVELYAASSEERELLRQQLSSRQTISDKEFFFSFRVNTDADYELLKEVTRRIVRRVATVDPEPVWPPEPIDGQTFIIIHSANNEWQTYGEAYAFTTHASGARSRLVEALTTMRNDGPPVYIIVYRPHPYQSFSAWARVTQFSEAPSGRPDDPKDIRWVMHLDQHEFPVSLDLKKNAVGLSNHIPWLAKGLAVAFQGQSIRVALPQDWQTIIDAARAASLRKSTMSLADAAFTILSRTGGGPLHLKEIFSQVQAAGLVETAGQTPQLSLSSALLRDERFRNLGGNMWLLAEPLLDTEGEDEIEPVPDIVVSEGTNFWRIHFPREWWDEARKHSVIGIDWPIDSTNQSVQRLKRIKVGDRVVVYFRGAVIGSIGVVTRPYYDVRVDDDPNAGLFGGQYAQRIGVAWSDAPAEPVPILDQLKQPGYTTLYNRLKNPHTVIPLSADDYQNILALTGGVDPATAATETRLPAIRDTLSDYLALAQSLGDAPVSADDLAAKAREMFADLKPLVDEDTLVADLRQLRLLHSAAEGYRRAGYAQGDATAIMRLMTLALLIPIEGSDAVYELPARTIVPRLQAMAGPQAIDSFAPELGADRLRMLEWYHEAGLITIDESRGLWQLTSDALLRRSGDDLATHAYNEFLDALLAMVSGTHKSDLDPAVGPLPPVPNLNSRLRELGQELLIDDMIVRRIYRSLIAGRHVVLSGPPGTGKTELAKRLPSLLWRENPQSFTRLTADLDQPPVVTSTEERHGYAAIVVTATEDWGVRDVVGGIGPQLDGEKGLGYTIQHGVLTRVLLQHYDGTDGGRRLPAQPHAPSRRDYRHEDGKRYRGAWLVIDEFTRAPVDAAFGSLLTTLSGGRDARLAVPTPSGELRDVPMPRDFRIIGTLNSFDRHFLNQISEALKRRFDFIDVPPPAPRLEHYEQGIAAAQALERLHANGFEAIAVSGAPPSYRWEQGSDTLAAEPIETAEGMRRYELHATSADAGATQASFWQLFRAIRVFRQLGTAQVIAVYTNLFAGVIASDMSWSDALDTALADSLADQLQVLTRDEQRVIDAYVEHAGLEGGAAFNRAFRAILKSLPIGRQPLLLHALRAADDSREGPGDIPMEEKTLAEDQIARIFQPERPFTLPRMGVFRRRLRDLIGERGL
jgi:5-methylcytosine-specific restriction enzyme B